MPRIFLCHCCDQHAEIGERIAGELTNAFGPVDVVRDTAAVMVGEDFRDVIAREVRSCDSVVAIVGPGWLDAVGRMGRATSLRSAEDVRWALRAASVNRIPVIPVWIAGAALPTRPELASEWVALAGRPGQSIRPDPDFRGDVDRLIQLLQPCGG